MKNKLTFFMIFIPSFLFLFGGTFYFGYQKQTIEMGVAFIVGAYGMVFSCLDKFEFFKGLGMEMRTRKLQQVVDEGDAILEKHRTIVLFTAESALTQVISAGRFGQSLRLIHETKAKVDNLMSTIGATQVEIDITEKIWRKYTIIDYVLHILGDTAYPLGINDEEKEKWDKLRAELMDNPPSAKLLRDFLNQTGLMDAEGEELLKDFEFFVKNFKLRRPGSWENRSVRRLRKFTESL